MASKNPQIRAIELEAKKRALADDGHAGRKELFDLRNQLRAEQGLPPERRKRGGLAGVYDRNKNVIKPAASAIAGMLGTPALGAAVGAAFGGFDRPGKGGIGFDVGGGVKGAATGYGLGHVGQFAGNLAGIGKVGALQGAGSAIGGRASNLVSGVQGKLGLASGPAAASAAPPAAAAGAAPAAPALGNIANANVIGSPAKKGILSTIGGFAKDNPEVIAQGLGGAANYMAAGSARAGDRDRLAFDVRRYEDEQEERRRRAEAAQKLYSMILGQMSFNQGGAGGNNV